MTPVSILSGDDVGTARSRSLLVLVAKTLVYAEGLELTATETAREVLKAMREPTEQMLEGRYDDPFWSFKDSYVSKEDVIECWQSMIDAALSQESAERERSSSQSTDGESK